MVPWRGFLEGGPTDVLEGFLDEYRLNGVPCRIYPRGISVSGVQRRRSTWVLCRGSKGASPAVGPRRGSPGRVSSGGGSWRVLEGVPSRGSLSVSPLEGVHWRWSLRGVPLEGLIWMGYHGVVPWRESRGVSPGGHRMCPLEGVRWNVNLVRVSVEVVPWRGFPWGGSIGGGPLRGFPWIGSSGGGLLVRPPGVGPLMRVALRSSLRGGPMEAEGIPWRSLG